jgi:cell division protein FtsL
MGFGIFVGFVASIITLSNITTNVIRSEIRTLYTMQEEQQAEVKRLQAEIRRLKLEKEEAVAKERAEARAEAEQKMFEGGLIAAALTGMAVVGPAVLEAMKQMR